MVTPTNMHGSAAQQQLHQRHILSVAALPLTSSKPWYLGRAP